MKLHFFLGIALSCLPALPMGSPVSEEGRTPPSDQLGGIPEYPKKRVLPGSSHTDVNGVSVNNYASSTGGASMTGIYGAWTDIALKSGFIGEVMNTIVVDNVSLAPNCRAKISGTGGSIFVSGLSSVEITNTTDPAFDPPGGPHMIIYFLDGTTQDVASWTTVLLNT